MRFRGERGKVPALATVPSGASRARGREVRHRPDATLASSTITRVMRRTGQHEEDRDADAFGRLGQDSPVVVRLQRHPHDAQREGSTYDRPKGPGNCVMVRPVAPSLRS